MQTYPLFDKATRAENLAFARARGFGTLALNGAHGPLLSHVPFAMAADGGACEIHLARSNPLLQGLDQATPAVLSVMGPDGYISPDWYDMPDQVPTWNYVSVTLRGRLALGDPADLRAQIESLSAQNEARVDGKPVWTTDKMTDGVLERMMRAIVLVRLTIGEVEGTWKLGQNKPDAARLAAANKVETGHGQNLAALSALMRASGLASQD